jgi:hypothetical protein
MMDGSTRRLFFWTIIYFYERYRNCSWILQYLTGHLQDHTTQVECSTAAGMARFAYNTYPMLSFTAS